VYTQGERQTRGNHAQEEQAVEKAGREKHKHSNRQHQRIRTQPTEEHHVFIIAFLETSVEPFSLWFWHVSLPHLRVSSVC